MPYASRVALMRPLARPVWITIPNPGSHPAKRRATLFQYLRLNRATDRGSGTRDPYAMASRVIGRFAFIGSPSDRPPATGDASAEEANLPAA